MKRQFARVVGALAAGLCLHASSFGQISDEVLKRQISGYANDLCASCHRAPGTGKELAPRIAGQQRAYIEAQLNAFREQSRREPEAYDCMWGLSSALNDGLTQALAGYFASQAPFAGISGDPQLIEKGRGVFIRPGQSEGMASCVQCHGARAEGRDAIPRLAGQLGPYLNRQLHVIRQRFRISSTMHGILQNLTDDELYWLALYLQSL